MSDKNIPLTIGGRKFHCTKLSEADFNNIAAIYVIICVDKDRKWIVIDVGQTGELGNRFDQHDRKNCWINNCPNKNIWVCIYPMPTNTYSKRERLDFEENIRSQYNPPCGKR